MGKRMFELPESHYQSVYESLVEAERRCGRPVMRNEVWAVHKEIGQIVFPAVFKLWMVLGELYRNDEILTDAFENRYSAQKEMQDNLQNKTGFELYSDRITRIYPSYVLDGTLKLQPGPTTETMNFNTLKDILLSTDLSRD